MGHIITSSGNSLSEEGVNHKKKEYWTTVARRKIYAKSLESLYCTVAHGWIMHKEKVICIYCGKEWYVLSEPCDCLMSKGDSAKRLEAKRRLEEIRLYKKSKAKPEPKKKEVQNSGIVLP